MDGGIYRIRNKVNGKLYIGRTKSFKRRFQQYIYDFNNQRIDHINQYLLNSMSFHGFENFAFEIVEICELSVQQDRELYYIEYYDTTNKEKGYNLRKDVNGSMITHEDTSNKISKRLKVEWENGVRKHHSELMKESWKNRDKSFQSSVMSRNLTKWKYSIDGGPFILYKELKELGLMGSLGKFSKSNENKIVFKGLTIERVLC